MTNEWRLIRIGAAAVAATSLMAGCAMSPAPAKAPPAGASAADTESADAGGAGEASRDALGAELKTKDGPADDPASSAVRPEEEAEESKPSTTRRQLSTVAEALDAFEEDEIRLTQLLSGQATALDTNTCGSVCDALASMRRASDAICDLAGEDDPRCATARDKLAGNEKRIEGRGCRCGQ